MAKVLESNLEIEKEVEEVEIPFSELPPEETTKEVAEKPKRKTPARRKKPAKKKVETGISSNEIGLLIQSVFGLVSLKAGEHWQVTPEEAETVAKPLSNILTKMDLLEKVSNVSDGAMLVVGLATLTIPRVIMTQSMKKERKNVNGQVRQIREERRIETQERQIGDSEEISYRDNGEIPERKSHDGEFIKGILATPDIQPI